MEGLEVCSSPEVLCASRQTRPALLLAVPVSCPRAALGDPIFKVLVQALQNILWGTEGALLCWVLYKHSMEEKVLFCPSRRADICNWQRTVAPSRSQIHLAGVLPKGKLDLKPTPKGESESRDGLTVQSGYLERASNTDVWSSALYSWLPPPTLRTRGCTALIHIH